LLGLWSAFFAASWIRSDLTTNDFERFHDPRLLALFLALFVALLAVYGSLLEREVAPRRRVAWAGFAIVSLPLLASFPVGSKDVFFYAFYGKMWGAYGLDPYVEPPSVLAHDDWYRFLPLWTGNPVVYGPLFTLQTRLLYALSGSALPAAVAAQKLLGLGLLASAALLLARLNHEAANGQSPRAGPARPLCLWLWSPLVLFEGLSSGHNDIAMAALILTAALLWLRGLPAGGTLILAASFWYKWYSIALVPAWLVWTAKRWGSRRTAIAILAGATFSAALLVPLFDSPASAFALLTRAVLAPFYSRLSDATLSGALSASSARLIFPDELPPPLWAWFRIVRAAGLFDRPAGIVAFDAVRYGGLAFGLGWIAWRAARTPFSPSGFVKDLFWSLAVFFSFAPPLLWPWYLVPMCGLGLAIGGRRYERIVYALTVAGLLSYFFTLTVALLVVLLLALVLTLLRRSASGQNRTATAGE
jgi:hypothetical protein